MAGYFTDAPASGLLSNLQFEFSRDYAPSLLESERGYAERQAAERLRQAQEAQEALRLQAMRDSARVGSVGAPGGLPESLDNPYESSNLQNYAMAATFVPGIGDALDVGWAVGDMVVDPENRDWAHAGLAVAAAAPGSLYWLLNRGGDAVLNTGKIGRQRGMFPGVKGAENMAKAGNDAPMQALRYAEMADYSGKTPDQIWRETAEQFGYPVYRGADGQWRFEIDDSTAQLSDRFWEAGWSDDATNSPMRLEDALTHPELAQAYPDEMHKTGLMFSDDLGNATGNYGDGLITIDRGTDNPMGTVFHESTHGVPQAAEGFARGGSPSEYVIQASQVSAARQVYDARRNGREVVKALRAAGVNRVDDPAFEAALRSASESLGMPEDVAVGGLLEHLKGADQQIIPDVRAADDYVDAAKRHYDHMLVESTTRQEAMDKYLSLAGEEEARAVPKRLKLTPEERAARPAWLDFDTPMDEQIVRYGDGPAEMRVYHGSPHKFDRFDMSQIGTGEGAQAYGHGIYQAQNPSVGVEYQKKLAGGRFVKHNGDVIDASDIFENPNIRATLERTDGDIDAAIARVQEIQESIPGTQGAELARNDLDKLQALKAEGGISRESGYLYESEIPDEAIDKMLDWDAPLSEQPWYRDVKELADEYKKAGKPADDYAKLIAKANARGDITGRQLYEGMQGTPAERSEFFARAGIPGIKYYDGGSRKAGDGTRNLVVFDDKLPRILSRNGQPLELP